MDNEKTPIQVQDRETVLDSGNQTVWRYGKRPSYSKTNKTLRAQSNKLHPEGSLEAIVQNLLRTFEMEATYKLDPKQWSSIVLDEFRMSTNNGPNYTAEEIVEKGTYNLFLGESAVYSSTKEDFESSSDIFKKTFPAGFVWEVEEVYCGPPRVVFKWRHWGTFEGEFQGYAPSKKVVEVIGLSVADVTDDLKIRCVEHYFDTSQFLNNLTSAGRCPLAR